MLTFIKAFYINGKKNIFSKSHQKFLPCPLLTDKIFKGLLTITHPTSHHGALLSNNFTSLNQHKPGSPRLPAQVVCSYSAPWLA